MARVPGKIKVRRSANHKKSPMNTFNLLRVFLAETYGRMGGKRERERRERERERMVAGRRVVADVSVTRQRIIVNTPDKKKE